MRGEVHLRDGGGEPEDRRGCGQEGAGTMTHPVAMVLAHGRAQDVFDRHLPLWKSHGVPVVVCTPEDEPIQTQEEKWVYGLQSHSGVHSRSRLIYFLSRFVNFTDHTHAVLFEYDSFCLQPDIRLHMGNGVFGILSSSMEPQRFISLRYPLPPWTVDRESAKALLEVAQRYPIMEE